jgi:hypothetical protein
MITFINLFIFSNFLRLANTFTYTTTYHYYVRHNAKRYAFISGKNQILPAGGLTSVVDLKYAKKYYFLI